MAFSFPRLHVARAHVLVLQAAYRGYTATKDGAVFTMAGELGCTNTQWLIRVGANQRQGGEDIAVSIGRRVTGPCVTSPDQSGSTNRDYQARRHKSLGSE